MIKKGNIIINKITGIILIITLTFTNFILLGVVTGKGIVSYAVDNLERQNSNTQHENVKFDAYFLKDGNKTHYLTLNTQQTSKLYFALNIMNNGYFKEGSIEIRNANYKIVGILETSEIMQKIEENKITLKQINYGTEAIVDMPIGIEIGNEFILENINKESSLVLKGIYITEEGEEIEIEKEIKINVIWTSQNELTVTNQISKYKIYEDSKKVLVQEEIKIKQEIKSLPIAKTEIEIEVPKYEGKEPEEIIVQANKMGLTKGEEYETIEFSKENWEYERETGKIKIKVENKEKNGKVWSGLGEDKYIVTYIYIVEEPEKETNIESKIRTTITRYNGEKNEKEIIEIKKLKEEIGEIIEAEIKIEEESISKGKLYANINSNNREYETIYHIKEMVEIGYIEGIEKITIEGISEQFIEKDGNKNSTKIGGVNYTSYTKTKLDEKSFKKILGEEGYIIVKNELGEEIGRIRNNNYEITYETKQDIIILETSKPIEEGNLFIKHEKVIKADIPYLKNQLISFKELEVGMKIGEEEKTETAQLEETTTKVDMTINKEVINHEENVEIKLELNNTKESSDLYKNPKFNIELPEYIEKAKIERTEILFEEELKTKRVEAIKNEDGKQEIQIELEGTQTKFNTIPNTKGTTIIIQAKLTASKTGEGKAKLQVINENAVNYSKEGNTQVVLNGYVTTYLDITENQETNNMLMQSQNINSINTNEINNENLEINLQEEENIYQENKEFTFEIELLNKTPDLEELVWTQEDLNKKETIKAKIEELEEKEELTLEEIKEIQNLEIEEIDLQIKYTQLEEKNYYELKKRQQQAINLLNNESEEILNSTEELTSEQILRLKEINNKLENQDFETISKEELQKLEKLTEKYNDTTLGKNFINDIVLNLKLEQYIEFQSAEIIDSSGAKITDVSINYDDENNTITVNLKRFPEKIDKKIYLKIHAKAKNIGNSKIKEQINTLNLIYEQAGEYKQIETKLKVNIGKVVLEVIKTMEVEKDKITTGDIVTFKLQIINNGVIDCDVANVYFKLPKELEFLQANYGKESSENEIEESKRLDESEKGLEVPLYEIKTGEKSIINLTTLVNNIEEYKECQVEASCEYGILREGKLENQEQIVTWQLNVEKTANSDLNQQPENNSNNYTISGLAWLDKDSNGVKSEIDEVIKGIEVQLIEEKSR